MIKTLVSFDLDWLNTFEEPLTKLEYEILPLIPKNIPAAIIIEHQHILSRLRRWVSKGIVPIPFEVLNIDEHHDFYRQTICYLPSYVRKNPRGEKLCCGNWGFFLPFRWYNSYVWSTTGNGGYCDWPEACRWMQDKKVKVSDLEIGKHDLDNPKREIIAVVFVVSPDFIEGLILENIQEAVDIIADYFDLENAPVLRKHCPKDKVKSWRVARRPSLVKVD